MDTTDAPQILEHATQSLGCTPFDCRWIPASARFVVYGQTPRATGVFQVYQLGKGKLEKVHDFDMPLGIKGGTFKASPISVRDCAVVDYKGKM